MFNDSLFFKKYFNSDFYKQVENQKIFFNNLKIKSQDPCDSIESTFENFLPERVSALFKDPKLNGCIRSLLPEENRQKLIIRLVDKLILEYGHLTQEKLIEFCLKVSLGVLTEGVVTAPIDGLLSAEIDPVEKFIKLNFSGTIRGAGGTICGFIVLIAEYLRLKFNLNRYWPTPDEIERNVLEILTFIRYKPTQIRPSKEEILHVIKNCTIMVDGLETEIIEVPAYKYLPRIQKPRLRNSITLVFVEGFIIRAKKIISLAKELKLETKWLEELVNMAKNYRVEGSRSSQSLDRYSLTIGKPVISDPKAKMGLSLRVGTTPTTGLNGCNVHANLIDLLGFMNIGSQLVVDLPGKATTITGTCDDLNPPLVRYKDGVRFYEVGSRDQVLEILCLGEILFAIGDFIECNRSLPKRDYCNGIFRNQLKDKEQIDFNLLSEEELFQLHKKYPLLKVPSRWSYYINAISFSEYQYLRKLTQYTLSDTSLLSLLHKLKVQYGIDQDKIVIKYQKIFENFLQKQTPISYLQYLEHVEKDPNNLNLTTYINQKLTENSKMAFGERGNCILNARIGRAESVNLSKMKLQIVHSLNEYKINSNVNFWKQIQKDPIRNCSYDLRFCERCNIQLANRLCVCSHITKRQNYCMTCKIHFDPQDEKHNSHKTVHRLFVKRNYAHELEELKHEGLQINEKINMKLLNSYGKTKYPEPLIKGVLRSQNQLPVTKDGTIRVVAPNLATTHFTAKQLNLNIEDLHKLGYYKDQNNQDLVSESQIIPLKINDTIISKQTAVIYKRIANFLDELFLNYYSVKEKYYAIEELEDLIGHTIVMISPHTSSGIVNRIIGLMENLGNFCHPTAVVARRRDLDGDIDGSTLFADVALNMSKIYTEGKVGSLMGVPLNLTTIYYLDQIGKQILGRQIEPTYYRGLIDDNLKSYPISFLKQNILKVEDRMLDKLIPVQEYYYNTPYFNLSTNHIKNLYKDSIDNNTKVDSVLLLQSRMPFIDQTECIKGVINGHIIPDLMGNSNSFFKQKLKCSFCKKNYTFEPLMLKCYYCKIGELQYTIHPKMVIKYVPLLKRLREYRLQNEALNQKIDFILKESTLVFDTKKPSKSLSDLLSNLDFKN